MTAVLLESLRSTQQALGQARLRVHRVPARGPGMCHRRGLSREIPIMSEGQGEGQGSVQGHLGRGSAAVGGPRGCGKLSTPSLESPWRTPTAAQKGRELPGSHSKSRAGAEKRGHDEEQNLNSDTPGLKCGSPTSWLSDVGQVTSRLLACVLISKRAFHSSRSVARTLRQWWL